MSSADSEMTAIVVDNGSTDGTLERVRAHSGVRLIANGQNRGFAAAANQGAREAGDSEFVLLLNPDANPLNSIDALVDACRQHGLAAGKLVDQAGRPQAGFTVRRLPTPLTLLFELLGINRLWPSNPVNQRYRELGRNLDHAGPAEQPAGAFLMIRKDVWEKLGGLDERFYPVWFEDVDFCRRALDAGHRIEYVPSVTAAHLGGHSVGRVPAEWRAVYWCVSLLRYSGKYFHPIAFRGICLGVALSSIPRMAVGMFAERSFSPLVAYLRIMRYAGACMLSPANVRKAVTLNP
jgi:N-acetylglucosaminyl-diphospho-decaprenol L-rhamnosyltransferase